MFKFSTPRTGLILLAGMLALTSFACSNELKSNHGSTLPSVKESLPSVEAAKLKLPAQSVISDKKVEPLPNPYELALDKAYSAFSISQSAESPDDWHLVANQWQEAIALLKAVPATGHNKLFAQTKITEYQRNLTYAQQQATHLLKENSHSVVAAIPETLPIYAESMPQAQPVFRATIGHRIGGTPVINVTFNGTQQFQMIVDTGASETVITQQMASALGVVPVATAKANTASDSNVKFSIGYVHSIQVGGAMVKDVAVAIAPSLGLEAGLLGHDFFENYDVTFKRDVIEFRPR